MLQESLRNQRLLLHCSYIYHTLRRMTDSLFMLLERLYLYYTSQVRVEDGVPYLPQATSH